MIAILLHLVLLLILPPLLLGVINKTKAFFAGRVGAPLLQPYYDIGKLLKKGMVVRSSTTWMTFQRSPASSWASVTAGLLIPLGNVPAIITFAGDFLLFAYLFALARFFTTSAALDTGSPFEGMGSAREVTFAVLTEPALFFAFLVLARLSNSISLGGMLSIGVTPMYAVGNAAPLVLIVLGLLIVLLAENCRLPVDDPTTHLELTMIHEAMILDHSGPLLGLIEYGSAIKLFVLESLVLNLVMPLQPMPLWLGCLMWTAETIALSMAIGFIESVTARLRMPRVPTLLIAAILLCGSAFVMLVR